MNIVDNNVNINKYITNDNKRHILLVNNISHWLKLNTKYINKENKSIISKYNKVLNQKDIDVLIKCIKHHIKIIPILYKIDDIFIGKLIYMSWYYDNFYMIKKINCYVKLYARDVMFCVKLACYNGKINVIRFLHKEIKLTKEDYKLSDTCIDICSNACERGYINIIKFLHAKIGFVKCDFQAKHNLACRRTCICGHTNIIKYLHQKIMFTKEDFQIYDNIILREACEYGHIDIIRYLHKVVELTLLDFRNANYNQAIRSACTNDYLNVVKYLHQEVKLTREDFEFGCNCAYRNALENNNHAIVSYLLDDVKIDANIPIYT